MKDKIKELQKKYKIKIEEVKTGDSIHEPYSDNERGVLSFFKETESFESNEYNDSGNLFSGIDSCEISSIGEIIEAQIEYLKVRNEAINRRNNFCLETESTSFNLTCTQCCSNSCSIT